MIAAVSNTVRYKIKHQTRYRYSEPVAICQNQLRMMPRTMSHMLARIESHQVDVLITPEPDIVEQHEDYFGNLVYTFAIESLHRELSVTIDSDVSIHCDPYPKSEPSVRWEDVVRGVSDASDDRWLEVQEYCFDSPRIRRSQRFADYALASFTANRDMIEATLDLTRRINHDFKYDTTATDVSTTTEKAFDLKAGVCQDFAHVQIAGLRSIGLPARYISGYLHTVPGPGQQRLVGADESHAWVSVYMGPHLGWIDVDPTNACRCGTSHIPICLGRDYNEVSPMRGVVLGGGKPQLQVSVDVEVLSES